MKIASGKLLYNTGSPAWHLDGLGGKGYTHTHTLMADLCCCMAETNTTLKSSYLPIKNFKRDSNLKNIQQVEVDVDLPFL